MKESAYKAAGVDIDAGEELVERIKPLAASTKRAGVMSGLGGFGAFFDLAAAKYRDPVLVSSTDGVGTKLRIAIDTGRHETVGIDLVAMCVNDLIVQGAQPLFFLDYFASGKLDVATGEKVISGIAEGCRQARCALIGGETAEMPGMYAPGDYDLAGFTVGAVERENIITGERIEAGDAVLGLASSGLHSNGFSLVRRLVETVQGLSYDAQAPFARTSLGEALLVPTRIYVRTLLAALEKFDIRGMANITGGGLLENIPRVIPEGLAAHLDAGHWTLPPVFRWLAEIGGLEAEDLARTLNCGIGMVVVCPPDQAEELGTFLVQQGETVWKIGEIVKSADPAVKIAGMEQAWKN